MMKFRIPVRACMVFSLMAMLAGSGCTLVEKAVDLPVVAVRTVASGFGGRDEIDVVSLQENVLRVADRFMMNASMAVEKITLDGKPISRDQQVLIKVRCSSDILSLSTGANGIGNLVNMLVYLTSARITVEQYWMPSVYGNGVLPLLDVLREEEKDIWEFAGMILGDSQQDELRKAIEEWRKNHKFTETDLGSIVNLSLVNDIIRTSTKSKVSMPSSVFSLLDVDPLAGLDPATRELAETRLFGERAMFIGQHMPQLLEWQMELLASRTARNPDVQQVVSSTQTMAAAGDRLSRTFEQVPSVIRQEREKILAALKEEQKGLADLSREMGQTMGEGSRMAAAADHALRTFSDLVTQLMAIPSDPSSQPFRILDYAETAEQINAMSRQVTEMLKTFGTSLEPENVDRVSVGIDIVVRKFVEQGEGLVDHVFYRAIELLGVLVLMICLGGLLTRLSYLYLVKRLFQERPAQSNGS